MYAEKAAYYIWYTYHMLYDMRQCHTAKKTICAVVQCWHHQQYICILYQKKKTTLLNKPQCTRGTSALRLAEKKQHTRTSNTRWEKHWPINGSVQVPHTIQSVSVLLHVRTNCINYVSVQCRCNDALSLFASFAYHLWKMVVKLPYCAPSASCHHSVLYNYTHYTLNHWSSGR